MEKKLCGKMALLLSTDSWKKMDIFRDYLSTQPRAVWRINSKYSDSYRKNIPFPINLYFFHENKIRFRARCVNISRENKWSIEVIPPKFRNHTTSYRTFIEIERVEQISEMHIKEFRKWDNPKWIFRRRPTRFTKSWRYDKLKSRQYIYSQQERLSKKMKGVVMI